MLEIVRSLVQVYTYVIRCNACGGIRNSKLLVLNSKSCHWKKIKKQIEFLKSPNSFGVRFKFNASCHCDVTVYNSAPSNWFQVCFFPIFIFSKLINKLINYQRKVEEENRYNFFCSLEIVLQVQAYLLGAWTRPSNGFYLTFRKKVRHGLQMVRW